MASGIGDLLETALSQGRALLKPSKQGSSPNPTAAGRDDDDEEEEDKEEEDEPVTARLSNAACLASSILATHGLSEVTKQQAHGPTSGRLLRCAHTSSLLLPNSCCCSVSRLQPVSIDRALGSMLKLHAYRTGESANCQPRIPCFS